MVTSDRSHIIYYRRHTTNIRFQLKEGAGATPRSSSTVYCLLWLCFTSPNGNLTLYSVIHDVVKTYFNNLTTVNA
jgi:hypothetical protein